MFVNSLCSRISSVWFSGAGRSTLNVSRNHTIFNDFACRKSVNECCKKSFNYPLILSTRYMAGHAKWQNIKHIKAEKDRLKHIMCNRYIRLVTAAIREKGPDPKMNNKLFHLLEEARKNNVPASTLESALKRANNKKLKPGSVEILGPGGCFIIVEYETDNISDTRHTLKVLCKKYSFNILSGEGRWRAVYEQKGVIKVTNMLTGPILDGEKVLDDAIEAGAEDVQKREDENDTIFYEFLSAPNDLYTVKNELEKNYAVEEAYVGYIPLTKVPLSEEDMILADKFLNELEDLPEICRLFENIE